MLSQTCENYDKTQLTALQVLMSVPFLRYSRTFSVLPPRAARRNEAESSDWKRGKNKNKGLSSTSFAYNINWLPTMDYIGNSLCNKSISLLLSVCVLSCPSVFVCFGDGSPNNMYVLPLPRKQPYPSPILCCCW